MRALIGEVCDRLGATADLKDIQIVRDLPDEPIPARGDGILLQAALQNLLDNAIKYSPEDSRIVVRVEQGIDLKVSIQDEGRGFGDADLTRLKTRYTRGTNVGDIVGSGLGLTIADEVTRAHGGRLEIVTNQTGVGACISLILPRI